MGMDERGLRLVGLVERGRARRRSSLYRLLVEDQATWEAGCGDAIPKGPSGSQTKSGASRAAAQAEQVADRAGMPEAHQRGMDAVLEHRLVLDQVQSKPGPLAL